MLEASTDRLLAAFASWESAVLVLKQVNLFTIGVIYCNFFEYFENKYHHKKKGVLSSPYVTLKNNLRTFENLQGQLF